MVLYSSDGPFALRLAIFSLNNESNELTNKASIGFVVYNPFDCGLLNRAFPYTHSPLRPYVMSNSIALQ